MDLESDLGVEFDKETPLDAAVNNVFECQILPSDFKEGTNFPVVVTQRSTETLTQAPLLTSEAPVTTQGLIPINYVFSSTSTHQHRDRTTSDSGTSGPTLDPEPQHLTQITNDDFAGVSFLNGVNVNLRMRRDEEIFTQQESHIQQTPSRPSVFRKTK